jgi:hypothetical protein
VRQAFPYVRRFFGEHEKTVAPVRGWTVKPLDNFIMREKRAMRKTLLTASLMLALCSTTFAGEMHTPPLAPVTEPTITSAGEIGTPGISDSLTQIALELLASVLP